MSKTRVFALGQAFFIISSWVTVIHKKYVFSVKSYAVRALERCEEISAPSSAAALTAFLHGSSPEKHASPAEDTSTPSVFLLLRYSRKRPSAIGLRQVFPVQTKTALFICYPFASYHVLPIFASLTRRTFILQAFSISSETIFLTASASFSGASTINSS